MADTRWRVTSDTQRAELSKDGAFTEVREIAFEMLASGKTGSVIIPVRNYTVEEVAARIQEYADRIGAIDGLMGG